MTEQQCNVFEAIAPLFVWEISVQPFVFSFFFSYSATPPSPLFSVFPLIDDNEVSG